jgi:hypothetical protein
MEQHIFVQYELKLREGRTEEVNKADFKTLICQAFSADSIARL